MSSDRRQFKSQMANAKFSVGDVSKGCEEYEMQNSVNSEPLGVNDVLELLQQQYAIISGGKSKEGCPIITFPDNNNFEMLSDVEYQRLMMYLTSVPSLHDADLGFHLIIDRRNDRWNSVKTVLLKISVYFPGLIHVVYVLRPASFLQKALSEVSNKLFKDEFKFRMIVLSTTEELHKHMSIQQLTPDLGGTLPYSHEDWIQQRIELERFSAITQQVSNALDDFTKAIEETELPNDVESTQLLLENHNLAYSNLKKDILSTAKHGEDLLISIKEKMMSLPYEDGCIPENGNIFAVERLLVQLEETEKKFDSFWQYHSNNLRNCIELRRFEQDFRELQVNFETHLKKTSEMVDIGDSVEKVDNLIKQTKAFKRLCNIDIDRAEEVISSGQHLINITACPIECVEPKCTELERVRKLLLEKLDERLEILVTTKTLLEKIENVNNWCLSGMELLLSQKIDQCSNSLELTEKYLKELKEFIASSKDYTSNGSKINLENAFQNTSAPEIKALICQVLEKIEEVSNKCNERITNLNKLVIKSKRHEPILPKQPQIGAPTMSNRNLLKKAYTSPKLTSGVDNDDHTNTSTEIIQNEKPISPDSDENKRIKTGHALAELLETEQAYVSELWCIIKGYKLEAQNADMQHLVPVDIAEKLHVIFGNLEDIYKFHSEVFLKDLQNCISSTELVALCFLQKRDTFFQLYNFYCQNISKSEQVRESSSGDLLQFFQACQLKLGHKLPLAAYLLKPVQRITKYQLLLKDLLRYSNEEERCKELQQALDCMLIVLKCLNDSMHQISITGFPTDLSEQGELLLQGPFNVWVESKRDLRLRIMPKHRHLFLYQKALIFCKPSTKATPNKTTYQFKHYLKMSQIGLTESVKGDIRRFEVWLQGRQEVHIIQAVTIDQKTTWVNEIKKVLFNQLEEIRLKQYAALAQHRPLRQTTSWERQKTISVGPLIDTASRALSCDSEHPNHSTEEEGSESIESENWDSDFSSDDEDRNGLPSGHYVALADYCAVGNSEVNMREGDIVELLKVGCAGWWFVKMIGTNLEGWAPAAYLENQHNRGSRSSSRSQDRLNV